ncbi:hypothetical protein [Tissierella sp.]|uniref:hypothetical protein n=1 Tax=Tissierella sp. TaxID=41274 RepID=UPI003F99B6F8
MDLYYRLKVIYIKIPPLRERKEDIIAFINIFVERFNKKYKLKKVISSDAMKMLLNHDWPGNVREIENEIERLMVTTPSDLIKYRDVLDESMKNTIGPNMKLDKKFRENVLEYEKALLIDYIKKSSDIHDLSDKTGLEDSTLRKKAKRLNVILEF